MTHVTSSLKFPGGACGKPMRLESSDDSGSFGRLGKHRVNGPTQKYLAMSRIRIDPIRFRSSCFSYHSNTELLNKTK